LIAGLLLLASVVYCAPLFSNLTNWGREDWDQFTFRYDTPRVALLRDRVLPTWNPYANGGTVLLAHPDSPVLSPWYAIVLLLGAPIGLRVQVVIFMALGAIGMAAFVGRLGARGPGMVAAGIAFMMSSHFALHVAEGHLEWCVLGLMPWLAWCVLRFNDGLRYVILGAFLLASVLTFGAVYIPAVFLPFLSLWVCGLAIGRRDWTLLLRWAGVVVLASLLATVKLLPTMQFTHDWKRTVPLEQRTPGRVLLAGLLDPRQVLFYQARRNDYLPDGHFAKKVSDADSAPVLKFLEDHGAQQGFHEYGCYIGVVGLLLAGWGGLRTARRFWPLYLAGVGAIVVVLGASAPIDLWAALRRLPLYSQLQVPSRFLAAVVFVLAVAVAFGLDGMTERLRRRAPRLARMGMVAAVALLYGESLLLGWRLFADVFVLPPVPIQAHSTFAQRFSVRSLYPIIMSSTTHPYLVSHSGTLEGYENLSVARGDVRLISDPAYQGEAYLEDGGNARVVAWTMSTVTVRVEVDRPNRLMLNQNFYRGWHARRRDAVGSTALMPAERSRGGLVSVPVDRQHIEVEFFYWPPTLSASAWISGTTLVGCLAGLWFSRRRDVGAHMPTATEASP
jgi:hypothetical protein